MKFDDVMAFLEEHADAQTHKTYLRHGARDPFFGVKVADLKKVVKKVKKDHALSLELYATGNSDAMYLAGLIADEQQMTVELLEEWLDGAYWYFLSEFTVPWVASESAHGHELALRWMESDEEHVAAAGWCTYSSMVATKPDDELNLKEIRGLLTRVAKSIHDQPNRVRHVMNAFVIAVGTYVGALTKTALKAAEKIGKVSVNMGDTACKVPLATAYIDKAVDKGRVGRKRKGARC